MTSGELDSIFAIIAKTHHFNMLSHEVIAHLTRIEDKTHETDLLYYL